MVSDTGLLAGMGAYSPDNAGKDTLFSDKFERIRKSVVFDQFDISRYIKAGRTCFHARCSDGRPAFCSYQLPLSLDEIEKIILIIFYGIRDRKECGLTIGTFRISGYFICKSFDFCKRAFIPQSFRHQLKHIDDRIDTDHANGAFTT